MTKTKFDFINRAIEDLEQKTDPTLLEQEGVIQTLVAFGESIERQLNELLEPNNIESFFSLRFTEAWRLLKYDQIFEDYKQDITKRLQQSPDKMLMISIEIKDKEVQIEKSDDDTPSDFGYEYVKIGYWYAISNVDPEVFDLLFNLGMDPNEPDDLNCDLHEIMSHAVQVPFWQKISRLRNLCTGFLRAHQVYFLKGLLDGDREHQIPAETHQLPVGTKLIWSGTPAEFGAIMSELINKGYMPRIKDLKNTVEILLKVFDIRTAKGELPDKNYLYKCFGDEKKRSYLPEQLNIPHSDNYNKSK